MSFKAEFIVEMTHGEHGTLSANPAIPPSGKVAKDTKITFTAVPEPGYKVDTWTITGGTFEAGTGTDGNTTAKVWITADTKVNVSFTNTYPVTFSVKGTPANGTLKAELAGTVITSGKSVEYGKTVTFTADPATGYKVDKWTITPASALQEGGTAGSQTAKVKITADTNVNVSFTLKTYPVNFSVDGGHGTLKAELAGSAIASGNPVEYGKTVTFTAKPDAGYKVNKWTITPASALQEGGTNGSTTAKVKITAATTVNVGFTELPPGSYTVKHYQEKPEGGYPAEPTETENKSGTVGTNAAYTPKTGGAYTGFTYKPALTKVNGTVWKNGTIAADNSTVVELYYERNTINVTFNLAGGSVSGDAGPIVKKGKYGASLTAPVPVRRGFVFKGWNPEPPTPLVFPAADTQYTADWAPLYTVTFSVDGEHGTLKATVDGVEYTTNTILVKVEEGKTVTFTATPSSGYEVKTWTKNGTPEAGTLPVYSCTVQADTDIKVAFKISDKTYTVNGVSFTMKGIAAVTNGTVGDSDQINNQPHTVSLSAYLIGEIEVTQELWQAVMGNNPSFFTESSSPPDSGEEQGKRPVENVNWYEALAFCNELTKQVNGGADRECVYYTFWSEVYTLEDARSGTVPYSVRWHAKGFRLPTEAEWEWAAMGGENYYKWAGTYSESELKDYAWYVANSNNKTHQVKMKSANDYGLYDMSGNVSEWCWDRYNSNSTPEGGKTDPTGANSGDYRVERGGSFKSVAAHAARAYRGNCYLSNGDFYLGLRVVCRP